MGLWGIFKKKYHTDSHRTKSKSIPIIVAAEGDSHRVMQITEICIKSLMQ